MRIRDWSSDVCSSDLRQYRRMEGDVQRFARRGTVGFQRDRVGERMAGEARVHAVAGVDRRLHREQAQHQVRARADFRGPRLAPGPYRRAHVMRSEEHTSELQSLMRISYAVFCLKKKNKKDKNHEFITYEN